MRFLSVLKKQHAYYILIPPILASLGLFKFTTSFFLAKHSLPQVSSCDDGTASILLKESLGLSDHETEILRSNGLLSSTTTNSSNANNNKNGCWVDRRVEAMAVIVVDALRFDFALQRLPLSIGARLQIHNENSTDENLNSNSQLFKFVADPPTVTMQRLKGLTTGGLPTFADISGSFGGANVDEDSWVEQVKLHHTGENQKIAFVGDDTWIDLFPTQFDESYPYPSFNTRDLDTVDDGCLLHLPRLLNAIGSVFEVVVVHFLGVDHVGHTYGPNNIHMNQKLEQMDLALLKILQKIDEAKTTCQSVYIFGDHGMTEDGNHGGGTSDEMNAALFAHYSPGCGDMTNIMNGNSINSISMQAGTMAQEAFQSINQIDIVPTISFLLGLPIPYANLGGLVPALLPHLNRQSKDFPSRTEASTTATALALNSAQVWNYLTSYSQKSNSLPQKDMNELKNKLELATNMYKSAISSFLSTATTSEKETSYDFDEACGLFKLFLSEATEMGKRVWTRFDTLGMGVGIFIVFVSFVMSIPWFSQAVYDKKKDESEIDVPNPAPIFGFMLYGLLSVFVLFSCVLLTFSNSYIDGEKGIVMFILAVICILASLCSYTLPMLQGIEYSSQFMTTELSKLQLAHFILIFPICCRLNEAFVTGHGTDPSLQKHTAHNPFFFIASLLTIGFLRFKMFQYIPLHDKYPLALIFLGKTKYIQIMNDLCDYITLILLAFSWREKYSLDNSRNGYKTSLSAMSLALISLCFMTCLFLFWAKQSYQLKSEYKSIILKRRQCLQEMITIGFKILFLIIAVTGPSSAGTSVFFLIQIWALYKVMNGKKNGMVRTKKIVYHRNRLYHLHSFKFLSIYLYIFLDTGAFDCNGLEIGRKTYFLCNRTCVCF